MESPVSKHEFPYILFAGYECYPCGGRRDEEGRFLTLQEARVAFVEGGYDWGDILNLDTGEWEERRVRE